MKVFKLQFTLWGVEVWGRGCENKEGVERFGVTGENF